MTTLRQKRYAEELVKTGGENKTLAAINAGYSPAVARDATQKIEERKGFQEYIDIYAPYKVLFKNYDYLLKQRKNLGISYQATRLGFELRGHLRYDNVTNINVNNAYQFVLRDEAGNIVDQHHRTPSPSDDTEEPKP